MLSFDQVSKTYGSYRALDQVSFQLQPGEIYGLLGPNGAGKTTIMNLICQLLEPDHGHITLNGQPLSTQTKQWLGMAPQENILYRSLTCEQNLNFFGKLYGLGPKLRQRRTRFCLQAVHLLDRAQDSVDTLSGGMQRRLNVAIALMHRPKLLILDEPTTGLDLETRQALWRLIQYLQGQGMTILLTTHLLEEAEHLCHRLGILQQGQLRYEGSLADLRALIPAQEILLLTTPAEQQAIARAQALGWQHRRYGQELAFWLPQALELREILPLLDAIPLESVRRQAIQLEHIYLEILNPPG
ncbi:ABC transporter ATP-binding protein [Synechocystis sp. LKSZ1]|uniref:ABC transporter ATP-binding protein n=1 Tax=Synechocystis sp. LKSZ1 TaxID=3144951 RepID=UPI00336BE20B